MLFLFGASHTVTEYELRRLYRRFKKLDRNGSGTLTADEFEAIPELSQNPLLSRLLAIFDKNKDEEIQFSEFVGTLATLSDKGSQDAKLRCKHQNNIKKHFLLIFIFVFSCVPGV